MANPLKASLERFRKMLAVCHHWRGFVDALNPWDQATARQHIYFDGLPPPAGADHTLEELTALRPFVICWHDLAGGFTQSAASAGACIQNSGRIIAQFEFEVPESLADRNPHTVADYCNEKLGAILGPTGNAAEPGLWDLHRQGGYLFLQDSSFYGYERTESKDVAALGDIIVAELHINWGVQ